MKYTTGRIFVETSAFSRLVKSGQISDAMLKQLQNDIMTQKGDTIRATGGLRKIRLASKASGKRGSWRVIYADYPKYSVTVLITAFEKIVQANLNSEQTRQLKNIKTLTDQEMERKHGKT